MQTIKLKTHVNPDGSIQLQMPQKLANQDIELLLVYQPIEQAQVDTTEKSEQNDPLIGLFSGSPDLATQSETILEQDLNQQSGFTWKKS